MARIVVKRNEHVQELEEELVTTDGPDKSVGAPDLLSASALDVCFMPAAGSTPLGPKGGSLNYTRDETFSDFSKPGSFQTSYTSRFSDPPPERFTLF